MLHARRHLALVRNRVPRLRARAPLALRSQQGFTLVELIIVLVIFAILVSIAIGANISMKQRAADAAAKSLLYQIVPSIETYRLDNSTYTGMTLDVLRASYDPALNPARYSLSVAPATYCVDATYNGETWRKNGPGEIAEKQACP